MITKKLVQDWGKIDRRAFIRENVHGVAVFTGSQGSGKSISMLNAALALYERDATKKIVYTNVEVGHEGFKFVTNEQMQGLLKSASDCIFMLDEIHLYYYSKAGAKSLDIIVPFSQLRKRNIVVFGTSQVWFHLDKSIRDQAQYLVLCMQRFWGWYFRNDWVSTKGYSITPEGNMVIHSVEFRTRFWRQRRLFDLYDSYQTIKLPLTAKNIRARL